MEIGSARPECHSFCNVTLECPNNKGDSGHRSHRRTSRHCSIRWSRSPALTVAIGAVSLVVTRNGAPPERMPSSTSNSLVWRAVDCDARDRSNLQRFWVTSSQVTGAGGQHLIVRTMAVGSGSWLPNIPINSVVVDPANFKQIWGRAADVGVYQTLDLGSSWAAFSNGLPNAAYGCRPPFSQAGSPAILRERATEAPGSYSCHKLARQT